MPEHGHTDSLHVVERWRGTTHQQGTSLASKNQSVRAARACAPSCVVFNNYARPAVFGPAGAAQTHGVRPDALRNWYGLEPIAQFQKCLAIKGGGWKGLNATGGLLNDLFFLRSG